MKKWLRNIFILVLSLFSISHVVFSDIAQDSIVEDGFLTPDSVVTDLYGLVSFESGELPDWEKVKSLFIEEAVIVFF